MSDYNFACRGLTCEIELVCGDYIEHAIQTLAIVPISYSYADAFLEQQAQGAEALSKL